MPKTVALNPNGLHYMGSGWYSSNGAGTEVTVLLDDNDGSVMTATEQTIIYYAFADITDVSRGAPVRSAYLTYRLRASDNSPGAYTDAYYGVTIAGPSASVADGYANYFGSYSWPHVTNVGIWNDTVFGMHFYWSGENPALCKLSAVVTYDLPAGGLAALIANWLGPLVAVGLHEMPRVVAEVWRRAGTIVLPQEQVLAWQELHTARWPRHFDLGRR